MSCYTPVRRSVVLNSMFDIADIDRDGRVSFSDFAIAQLRRTLAARQGATLSTQAGPSTPAHSGPEPGSSEALVGAALEASKRIARAGSGVGSVLDQLVGLPCFPEPLHPDYYHTMPMTLR